MESVLRWHALSREEQGAYYERAREEKVTDLNYS